jgi:hypothetical protein
MDRFLKIHDGILILRHRSGSMRTGYKWVVWALGALVLLSGLVWGLSRLLGPTAAQEAALAAMDDPPMTGRNAFGAMWLMPYDIPEAQREAVLAEDLRRFRAAGPPEPDSGTTAAPMAVSSAEGRFPATALTADEVNLHCGSAGGCLEKVAADRARYAALVERHARLIDRAEALSAYDHIAHPTSEALIDVVLPPYQLGRLPATRHALLFVDGRRGEALDGTCRAIATWRRLGARSDNLIARMIGIAYAADVHGALFAEMLAQVPRDEPLPASCTQAFAPIGDDELSMCRAMRGEFRFLQSALREARRRGLDGDEGPVTRTLQGLYFDIETTEADRAEDLAWYCSDEARTRMRADLPVSSPAPEKDLFRFQCIANAAGCILAQIAAPSFESYPRRVQDANAKLRLLALLVRLRAETDDARPFAERLRAHAADVGSAQRRPAVDAGGRTLQLRLFDTQKGETWRVPLPPYFRADLDADAAAAP